MNNPAEQAAKLMESLGNIEKNGAKAINLLLDTACAGIVNAAEAISETDIERVIAATQERIRNMILIIAEDVKKAG
jgi:hypothetical protein